jgi:protein-tyrosine phosphatase
MIDLHCHVLPNVDDGAGSVESALDLCRLAASDGITHMVLTPHVHPGRYDNTLSSLTPHFDAFMSVVEDHGVPIEFSLAGEVRLCAEVLQIVSSNNLPILGYWGDKQVVLLEFPHGHIPPGSDKLAKWFLSKNIIPMIAHPERNKAIIASVDVLNPFIEMGCLLQLTAMSVTGEFGEQAHERAHDLLSKGWVTVIATDAHNQQHRPPILSNARYVIEDRYGSMMAEQLFESNQRRLLRM